MPKRSNTKKLKGQPQKKAKLTLNEIEENSIDQLLAQPIPALKETLEKLLATNNEEIARLTQLNEKISECLDRIEEQEPGWSKLPEKVWLRVFKHLKVKDLNNVHLVCRNLHRIGNLHVNPKLSFKEDSKKDLESLFQSSRIFEKLEFSGESGNHWLLPENFEILEEFISFTGSYIKKLIIEADSWGKKVDPKILLKFLNLLPNLESLVLEFIRTDERQEPIKWDLKSRKIERIKICACSPEILRLLEPLDKCAIKEADLQYWSQDEDPEVTKKFLEAQGKNLKKLITDSVVDLKDLRLEYLEFDNKRRDDLSLDFLRNQVDLNWIRVSAKEFSTENFDAICELSNLESLDLFGEPSDGSGLGLNNLHKLRKLKKFMALHISPNILEHLQFGVFNDLEDLNANFEGASVDSIQEMKRIAPNLKEITMHPCCTSDQINAMLDTLENLESMTIWCEDWKIPAGKVYPNLKYLDVDYRSNYKFSLENFSKMLPNLETLYLVYCPFEITESFLVTLLNGLKQLKKLSLYTCNLEVDADEALQCIRDHGENLRCLSINGGSKSPHKIVDGYRVAEDPGNKIFIRKIK